MVFFHLKLIKQSLSDTLACVLLNIVKLKLELKKLVYLQNLSIRCKHTKPVRFWKLSAYTTSKNTIVALCNEDPSLFFSSILEALSPMVLWAYEKRNQIWIFMMSNWTPCGTCTSGVCYWLFYLTVVVVVVAYCIMNSLKMFACLRMVFGVAMLPIQPNLNFIPWMPLMCKRHQVPTTLTFIHTKTSSPLSNVYKA